MLAIEADLLGHLGVSRDMPASCQADTVNPQVYVHTYIISLYERVELRDYGCQGYQIGWQYVLLLHEYKGCFQMWPRPLVPK